MADRSKGIIENSLAWPQPTLSSVPFMAPQTTMSPPVHLSLPSEAPKPAAGCDVCAALANQRSEAHRRGDHSTVSDCNVEIVAHRGRSRC